MQVLGSSREFLFAESGRRSASVHGGCSFRFRLELAEIALEQGELQSSQRESKVIYYKKELCKIVAYFLNNNSSNDRPVYTQILTGN